MTKTSNYDLNQWDASDRVLREDFNADNEKIDAALGTIPKIQTGSYVGTGTYGPSSPNTLTFSFRPQLVIIVENGGGQTYSGYFIRGSEVGMTNWIGGSTSNFSVALTWNNDSVSWYSGNGSEYQLNRSGITYCYLAIG